MMSLRSLLNEFSTYIEVKGSLYYLTIFPLRIYFIFIELAKYYTKNVGKALAIGHMSVLRGYAYAIFKMWTSLYYL